MDVRVNTADDSSTPVKNFVNYDPVTAEFCSVPGGLHAAVFTIQFYIVPDNTIYGNWQKACLCHAKLIAIQYC